MILPREAGGILRGPLPENTARTSILVAMLTLAIYMSILVDLKTLTTFKRRNTLYFWSLLITSWGIISHSLGIVLKWFVGSCPWEVHTAFASFGWWGMVTGQSLVLYSRLHLVVRDQRILRAVLAMIIADFCIFQVPTTIQTFGSNQSNPGMWLTVYNVYERIQLIVFTLQESIISVIYIHAAVNLLSPSDPDETRHTKKFLIYLNLLCIGLDIAFVGEVFSGEWVYKTGTQSLAYAIKLTIEFVVLNKLMEVYRLGPGSCASCRRRISQPGISGGQSRLEATGRAARPALKRNGSSSQSGAMTPGWPRKSRGLERLGPFEEEEMIECSPPRGASADRDLAASPTSVRFAKNERDIVVTTKITTLSQDAARGQGSQSFTMVAPQTEVWL